MGTGCGGGRAGGGRTGGGVGRGGSGDGGVAGDKEIAAAVADSSKSSKQKVWSEPE